MGEGWIKTHRKVKNHWLYQEQPFDRYHAWEDILMSVNHVQNTFLHGNTLLTIEPGQFVTSMRKLGERWGWSQEKVRRFLNLLVSDAMIRIECDTKKTVITVENWGFYQSDNENARHKRDTDETATKTNKNEKNVKKEKVDTNVSTKKKFSAPVELEPEWTGYVQMRKELKKPLTDRAAKMAVKKLEELAPRDYELQKRILDQSTFNSWQGLFALKAEKAQFSNSPQQNSKRKSFTELVAERTKT